MSKPVKDVPTVSPPAEEKKKSAGQATAKITHTNGESFIDTFDYGDGLDAAVTKYGEDAIFTNYLVGAKTSRRNRFSQLVHGKNPLSMEAARDAMKDWKVKPVGTREGKDQTTVAVAAYESATPEQKADILKALQEKVAGLKA